MVLTNYTISEKDSHELSHQCMNSKSATVAQIEESYCFAEIFALMSFPFFPFGFSEVAFVFFVSENIPR